MKKAFDQTVRDLKREVNKKVLKVPGIEQKVLDATSNEAWGPHGSHLADIAQATRNYHEYQLIMSVLWKRINDTGKNWRHVYKALIVLDYLVAHGSERVIDEIREHSYQIQTLSDFQYIDSSGRDQGSNVRRKSQSLVTLVNDKERIHEVRQKAYANRDKFQGPSSTGGMYKPSSYSSSGGYGDRNDDDRYGGRYGSRDDDRNGYGRDWGNRDDGSGRGGDSYYRDGDRYSNKDFDDRNSRDSYRDDEYRSKRTPDDYQYGRNRSFGSDKERPSEDERNPPRQIERKPSEQSIGTPPTYEEALGIAHNQSQGESGKSGGMSQTEPTAISAQGDSMPAQSQGQPPSFAAETAYNTGSEIDTFDEFDPRGQMSATPALATNTDILSSLSDSLALVPVEPALAYDAKAPSNSGNGTMFVPMTAASSILNQPSENPFGDSPFKATLSVNNFSSPPETSLPTSSLHSTTSVESFGDGLQGINYAPSFNTSSVQLPSSSITGASQSQFLVPNQSNDILAGLLPPIGSVGSIQTPPVLSGYGAPVDTQSAMLGYQFPMGGSQVDFSASAFPTQLVVPMVTAPGVSQQSPFGQSSLQQVDPPATTIQVPSLSTPSTALAAPIISNLAPTSSGPLPVNTQSHPTKEKFETKSTVWTDTLNRGLVDLNISGPKINPLADIGIDFDSINRKEKRKEKSTTVPATSTTTMGKAMGSGSGVGRTGASVLSTPRLPMIAPNMGMGMNGGAGMMGPGMAGNINMMGPGMGMGTYAGVHPPGMGMGMGQGMQMPPAPAGMQGVYNPMMGMGAYAPQQPYGGYR